MHGIMNSRCLGICVGYGDVSGIQFAHLSPLFPNKRTK